jgi:hypothetical protein
MGPLTTLLEPHILARGSLWVNIFKKCRPTQNNQANLQIFLGRRGPSSCCGSAA